MKAVLVVLLLVAVFVNASTTEEGISTDELARVLADEPASASEARFMETRGSTDTITISGASSSPTGSLSGSEVSSEETEFDGQIAQFEEDVKKVKLQIRESQKCARRLFEQQAELRNLQEQITNLNKEKQKFILQGKLEKQMKDLSEINRMSRTLRQKFGELKRTQQLIKTKLTGTKSSLNQLEGNADMSTSEINESAKDIVSEVDTMHKAQSVALDSAHKVNSKEVKNQINQQNKIAIKGREASSESDI